MCEHNRDSQKMLSFYKPISFMVFCCKIEKELRRYPLDYIRENKILQERQYRLLPGR